MSYRISFLGVNKTGKLRKENEAKKVKKSKKELYVIVGHHFTVDHLRQVKSIYLSRIQD